MFKRSLGVKIALWTTMVLIIVFVGLTMFNFSHQKELVEQREELAANALGSTILGAIRYPMLEGEQDVIQRQFEMIKEENDDLFVHLTDEKGVIKRTTETEMTNKLANIDGAELRDAFAGKTVRGIVKDRTSGDVFYQEIVPIVNEQACNLCHGSSHEILGLLWMGKDFKPVEQAVAGLGVRNGLLSAVGCVVAIVLIIFLSHSMLSPLQSFVKVAGEIAQGNLTQQIEVTSEDEVGRVGSAFNEVVSSLRKMVGDVIKVAENVMNSAQQFSYITQQMSEGIQQINGAMNQITTGVTNQTSQIENVSRIMDSVKLSLKGVEEKAKVTADGSEFAADQVNTSGERMENLSTKMDKVNETVKQSVELIKSLEERSQQIGEITVAITNIADQTNLLSLNAAIEAARAGEAGLGFGVVADEIRKLAESSAQAASRIGVLIRNIQEEVSKTITSIESGSQQVSEGREVVSEVRGALSKVISSVNEASRMSQEIAIAINEQLASSTQQVGKAIEDVSSIAEQTSSSVEETTSSIEEQTASMEEITSAAQDLSNLAKEMKKLVEQFKIA